jgi:hypothetical protein
MTNDEYEALAAKYLAALAKQDMMHFRRHRDVQELRISKDRITPPSDVSERTGRDWSPYDPDYNIIGGH